MSDKTNSTTVAQPRTTAARVYVPTAVNDTVHRYVKNLLADEFGGYSAYDAEGGWISDDGRLIEEKSVVYEAVTDLEQPEDVVKEAARRVKEKSAEDAVLWEVRPITSHGFA